jgi:hypothetical protein
VEVFTADDDGAVHLGGHNTAGQDTATDGDETGEGALLVCTVQSVSWLIISKGYGDSGKIFRIADSFLEGGGCGIHWATEKRREKICFHESLADA